MGVSKPGSVHFSQRNPFARLLFLAIFLVLLFLFFVRPAEERVKQISQHFENLHKSPPVQNPLPDCSINSTRLQSLQKEYNLGDNIEYGQRYIKIRQENIRRRTLTKINTELFPKDFEVINLQNPGLESACWHPIEIIVPRSSFPNSVNASELLFGISTTYKRLYDEKSSPMKEWAHWLTDGKGKTNGAGLILRLVDASDQQLAEARQTLTLMGIDAQVSHSSSSVEMAQRYLSLVPTLYSDAIRKQRKWLVMCDDDTFFPSMHALLSRLSGFNHKADMYIGTFSEDVNNIQRHGSQAFGGAGVFLSMHLAGVISSVYDQCVTSEKIRESNTGWGPQGDILLRKCIYENTEVRLTMMPELHQLDIQGDPSGFYESGLAPLSLHHFKGGMWHSAQIHDGAKIIQACGEDCFLQRFLTTDDFIISNGYSVAYYPRGIEFDVNQIERTFHPAPDDHGWNFDFVMGGPGRRSLVGTGRKIAWELKDAVIQDDGSVRQSYIRRADDGRWTENGQAIFELDGILDLIWIP